ncbi:DUF6053 domain-containing protein [Lysobacter enzymogenes]|uniref:DUF6053 domain-containing protein n=1 Tax=Lysobacter enzymogenes TaxID=69 RepID=UPI00374A383B
MASVRQADASIAVAGGPSGPTLFAQGAAIGAHSVGPEGPPTKAVARAGDALAC